MTDVAARSRTQDFAEFYATHFDRVARQLYAYLGDRDEAQDAAQEAFCRAYDRWARISEYDDSLAWVRRVAWNLATSRLRHLRAAARYALRQRQAVVEGPGPDRVALVRALSTLPPKHRLAVVLHHIGDLSVAEIAAQHEVPENTVKTWLSRGRSQLADYFAEEHLNRPELLVFQPAAIGAITATVKRRRAVRRSTVAAVLAVALAVPLALLIRARGTEPPIIEPTPLPSPSLAPTPSPSALPVAARPVRLPGVQPFYGPPIVTFVTRDVGWVVVDKCPQSNEDRPGCGMLLGRTVDSGRTWSPVELPAFAREKAFVLLPFDTNTLTLQMFWDKRADLAHTTDGGATFTRVPIDRPPAEARLARGGPFQMLCPGATGLESTGPKMNCDRRQLVRAGGARPPTPPLTGPFARAVTGGDGRVWLVEEGEIRVSADEGRTWSDVPEAPGDAWEQSPRISPDGRHLWLEGNGKLLHLNDNGWQEVGGYPADYKGHNNGFWRQLEGWAPLDGGLVVISYDGKLAFLDNGELMVVPAMAGGDVEVLRDGTIVVTEQYGGRTLGVGAGKQREWITFAVPGPESTPSGPR